MSLLSAFTSVCYCGMWNSFLWIFKWYFFKVNNHIIVTKLLHQSWLIEQSWSILVNPDIEQGRDWRTKTWVSLLMAEIYAQEYNFNISALEASHEYDMESIRKSCWGTRWCVLAKNRCLRRNSKLWKFTHGILSKDPKIY